MCFRGSFSEYEDGENCEGIKSNVDLVLADLATVESTQDSYPSGNMQSIASELNQSFQEAVDRTMPTFNCTELRMIQNINAETDLPMYRLSSVYASSANEYIRGNCNESVQVVNSDGNRNYVASRNLSVQPNGSSTSVSTNSTTVITPSLSVPSGCSSSRNGGLGQNLKLSKFENI